MTSDTPPARTLDDPPFRGEWKDVEITSEQDLLNLLVESSHDSKWVYRGQARREWTKLWPTFFRMLRRAHDQEPMQYSHMRMLEQRAISRFMQRAVHLLEPADHPLLDDIFQRYIVMQHFRAPTRLIDWSRSPWVALYFAVCSDPDHDGTLWRMDWDELELRTGRERHESNQVTESLSVPHVIRQFFGEVDPPTVWPLIPARANNRIAAQQSIFTIGSRLNRSHDDLLAQRIFGVNAADSLTRFHVPSDLKTRLVRMLARMNVSAATLFPGVDGLGLSISELVAANEPAPALLMSAFVRDGTGRITSFVPPDFVCF